MNTTKQKSQKIQILRAVAIIAVVLIHTCPNGQMQVFIRPFVNYAVALFLFISGYLTSINNQNWLSFYKKRIIRVIIPYFIWTILYTSFSFIGGSEKFDFTKYVTNMLSTKATETLYYIFVYIQFVILTPFMCKLAKSKFNWLGWFVSPLSLIVKYYWLFSGTQPNQYVSILYGISCLGWFTFYYLGLLLGNNLINKQYNQKKIIIIYFISIALQVLEGYIWFSIGDSNCGTQLKLSALLSSSIFILLSFLYLINYNKRIHKKLENILVLIGDYSFGIYLSHILIIRVLNEFPIWAKIPFGLNSIIVLIFTILFIWLFTKTFNKKICKWFGFN